MIVTADELMESREFDKAGLDVSTPDAEQAIREAEAALYIALGYSVADDSTEITVYGTGDPFIFLPHRARSITAVTQDGVAVPDTAWYLSGGGFLLKRGRRGYLYDSDEWSGYWYPNSAIKITGTFGYDPGDPDADPMVDPDHQYTLAKRAVRVLAVRYLSSTDEDQSLPNGADGQSLTSYTAEGASFQFSSDDPLTELINTIGLHPMRKKGGLKSVQLIK